jgi:hypothetical protein
VSCSTEPHCDQRRQRRNAADGAIPLAAKSAAVGVGLSWGKGTLDYQGKTYTVTVDGLLVVAFGMTSVTAEGGVYHMKAIEDFDGNYVAVRGGSTIGEGWRSERHQIGVEVRLLAQNAGVTFTLGRGGVTLALEKQPEGAPP